MRTRMIVAAVSALCVLPLLCFAQINNPINTGVSPAPNPPALYPPTLGVPNPSMQGGSLPPAVGVTTPANTSVGAQPNVIPSPPTVSIPRPSVTTIPQAVTRRRAPAATTANPAPTAKGPAAATSDDTGPAGPCVCPPSGTKMGESDYQMSTHNRPPQEETEQGPIASIPSAVGAGPDQYPTIGEIGTGFCDMTSSMVVDNDYVYVLRGNQVVKLRKSDMAVMSTTTLPPTGQ